MEQKKIYLACPYSSLRPDVREARFKSVSKVAARLIKEGYLVFSPISHSHQICIEGEMGICFETWKALDTSLLNWADNLVVLKLEGWEKSKGVTEEIAIAKYLGKSIFYMEYEE
jgi:hypothetical protein